eukprot:gene14668-biopygen18654
MTASSSRSCITFSVAAWVIRAARDAPPRCRAAPPAAARAASATGAPAAAPRIAPRAAHEARACREQGSQ